MVAEYSTREELSDAISSKVYQFDSNAKVNDDKNGTEWSLEGEGIVIGIRLHKEPIDTTYFNIEVSAKIDGHEYVYGASEIEYSYAFDEIQSVGQIISSIFNKKYSISEQKFLYIFKRTYLDVKGDGYDISMLKQK